MHHAHANRLVNLQEMLKFLNTFNLPRLNQEDTGNQNIAVTIQENEAVIKFPIKGKFRT